MLDDRRKVAAFSYAGAGLPANLYPRMKDEQVRLFSDYIAWVLIWDDIYDTKIDNEKIEDKINLCFNLISRLEQPERALLIQNPLAHSLLDISKRMRLWASPFEYDQFVCNTSKWIASYAWGTAIEKTGEIENIDTYLAYRAINAGCNIMHYMAGVSNDALMAPHELTSDLVRAFIDVCTFIVAADNDIYSRAKSNSAGEESFDLIDFCIKSKIEIVEEDALLWAVGVRNYAMRQYMSLRERLLNNSDEKTRRFVFGCDDCIVGNVVFGVRQTRYSDINNAYAKSRWISSGGLENNFLGSVKSTSWWWEV
ncbi:(+)-T-muurolol synthase [Burkholderia lata]|nr:(+)-T-muurolol synthase [Burkholderia lata]